MNLRRSFSLVVLTLATLAVAAGPAAADRDRWHLLGTRTVNDRVDRDVVTVTAARGTYDAIKLTVKGRAVQFQAVTIHFGDGEDQNVELREVIPAGGESRVIDIDGHDRVIRTITLVYDAQSKGAKAKVRIYGRG
jgi:hypothetical protein